MSVVGPLGTTNEQLETCTENIYEHQIYAGKGEWSTDVKGPWLSAPPEGRGSVCHPPDEVNLPDADWTWTSNWRFETKTEQHLTDRHGWEYA
jgi:hypothetical protein